MEPSKEESLIHNIKLSSVGPGWVTGADVVHEPSGMDLAMKLHYLRGVYYFRNKAFQGLTIANIKEPMFMSLNRYYFACGRFRRSESGRPYIKCNDCGARFIEAQCDMTVDEWIEMNDVCLEKMLVSDQVIGPELGFSPLVLIQLTKFKCGGISMGLSWAHVLGDAFFAAEFINLWAKLLAGHHPAPPIKSHPKKTENPPTLPDDPISVKRVGPVGDHWVYLSPNHTKMAPFSLHVSAIQLTQIQSKISGQNDAVCGIPPFESICAVIWQCVARVKNGSSDPDSNPKVVTICRNGSNNPKKGNSNNNNQVVAIVKSEYSVTESDPKDLALLIANQAIDERTKIEEMVERENGLLDLILYGANLTFVDLESTSFYGLEVNGKKPVYVNYTVDGVGDEGMVLVLPAPEDDGRIVTVIWPENEVSKLRSELKREWSIA